MRQARKRAIARRKPYQVGFGITLGVFLSLAGLMVFERIMMVTSLVGFAYQAASDTTILKYGESGTMGPLDWMAVILVTLFFTQIFRAFQAWRRSEASWAGAIFGLCNIGTIGFLTFILVINWAFHNPLNYGAPSINGLSRSPLIFSDFVFYEGDIERPRNADWHQIDERTYCHAKAGIIEREEIIKPGFPLEHQRANFLARNPYHQDKFRDASRAAKFYYDLDWNLLTIRASERWPSVSARLQEAEKPAWDADLEVYYRFETYRRSPELAPLITCDHALSATPPAPTYAPYTE